MTVRWEIKLALEWDEANAVARTVAVLGEVEQTIRTFPLTDNTARGAFREFVDDLADEGYDLAEVGDDGW